jgi:hypothetical protein
MSPASGDMTGLASGATPASGPGFPPVCWVLHTGGSEPKSHVSPTSHSDDAKQGSPAALRSVVAHAVKPGPSIMEIAKASSRARMQLG